jgi:hypothetical protein
MDFFYCRYLGKGAIVLYTGLRTWEFCQKRSPFQCNVDKWVVDNALEMSLAHGGAGSISSQSDQSVFPTLYQLDVRPVTF